MRWAKLCRLCWLADPKSSDSIDEPMSDPLLPQPMDAKLNRLDPPHDLMSSTADPATSWLAMAGRDPASASDHLDRQTSELLAHVQQQNEEIDARQSELNARLAQLDNELRAARLKSGLDGGTDLSRDGTSLPHDPSRSDPESIDADRPADDGAVTSQAPEAVGGPTEFPEFEEVEKLVAQLSGSQEASDSATAEVSASAATNSVEQQAKTTDRLRRPLAVTKHVTTRPDPNATQPIADSSVAEQPSIEASLSGRPRERAVAEPSCTEGEIDATFQRLDAGDLESQQRILAERTIELNRRESLLHELHGKVKSLYAEALESQLATEQLWNKIVAGAGTSEEEAHDSLSTVRQQLDEFYVKEKQTLNDQKAELIRLQNSVEERRAEVNSQSGTLRDWMQSRHQQLTTFAAEVDERATLLDRREHRMRQEFSQWEAQRRAYQEQLHGLLKKLGMR